MLIGKNFELFGAASAGQLICDPKALLHFDLNLLNPNAGGSSAGYQFLSWRVIDIPSKPRMNRMDPFHVLGVERGSLPKPSESHSNVWIKIRYLNGSGGGGQLRGLGEEFQPRQCPIRGRHEDVHQQPELGRDRVGEQLGWEGIWRRNFERKAELEPQVRRQDQGFRQLRALAVTRCGEQVDPI